MPINKVLWRGRGRCHPMMGPSPMATRGPMAFCGFVPDEWGTWSRGRFHPRRVTLIFGVMVLIVFGLLGGADGLLLTRISKRDENYAVQVDEVELLVDQVDAVQVEKTKGK